MAKLTTRTRRQLTLAQESQQTKMSAGAPHEPEELLVNRPPVKKVVSLQGMDQAIRKYARGQR